MSGAARRGRPGTLLRDAAGWALERQGAPPAATARARAALERCIDALAATAWADALPCFSGLNASGFPIELAFSSRDQQVRYTAEVAPPEVAEGERLARAVALLAALGAAPVAPAALERMRALQAGGRLAWGAVVGGRHAASGDRFKLYAEVPAAGEPPGEPALHSARLQRRPRLVMLGLEAGAGHLERYYRSEGLAPGELGRLLAEAGLGDRAPELERAVEAAWEGSAEVALGSVWGLSLAGAPGRACQAVSLFKEANGLLGGDARARARLLALVPALEAGAVEGYARASAPLADAEGFGAHGMLAFTVAPGRPLELRIGIDPAVPFQRARRARPGRAA